MQVVAVQRDVKSGGVEAQGMFAISATNQAHIMAILREGLYTDRILAVLREYASNAWDAHRMSGKADLPIKVVLPTDMNPTLIIRDFGMGMSEDTIFNVFTQYGDSTKRDSNVGVGMLGIGSKSGFAYSDTFTVISYHGGKKRTYVAVLDHTDIGTMSRLCEDDCGDEVGIEIQIPVKRQDLWLFNEKAKSLFRYFDPKPNINMSLPTIGRTTTKSGFINDDGSCYNSEWIAVMGCVPYRVNMSQIQADLEKINIYQAVTKMSGGIFFDIGDVQISANREELKYTDATKNALVEKLAKVLQEYLVTLMKDLNSVATTDWEKRIKVMSIAARWQGSSLVLPDADRGLSGERVFLWNSSDSTKHPKTFIMLSPKEESISGIPVAVETRLVIKDDPRTLKGWKGSLSRCDYVIRPNKNANIADVRAELEALITASRLTGIETVDISTMTWHQYTASSGRNPYGIDSSVYYTNQFRLKTNGNYGYPWSSCWETVKRQPEDDDVFVVISSFLPRGTGLGGTAWFQGYQRDQKLVTTLGGVMPPVYAYKTTDSAPVDETKCKGIPYAQWRKDYIASLSMSPEMQANFDTWQWSNALEECWRFDRIRRIPDVCLAELEKELGATHLITDLVRKYLAGTAGMKKMSAATREMLPMLADIFKVSNRANMVDTTLKTIRSTYPLLGTRNDNIHQLWEDERTAWCQYVRMVDREIADPMVVPISTKVV